MRAPTLIDTGPIVALVNQNDPWHEACVVAFQSLQLPLLTSEAVLTEVFHLLGNRARHVDAAWRIIRSGMVTIGAITDDDLGALNILMSKYRDHPMDFADATLVHLAQRESLSLIFTLDHDDFETYRIEGRKTFRIVPGRADLHQRS